MYYEYGESCSLVDWYHSFNKEQLVGLGSRPWELKEIASVNHSHFLEGRIEKWHSSYSP